MAYITSCRWRPTSGLLHQRPRRPPFVLFVSNQPPTAVIDPLSLHDALPISLQMVMQTGYGIAAPTLEDMELDEPEIIRQGSRYRSEEHTSELQSRFDLVCRLLLEKKKEETRLVIGC